MAVLADKTKPTYEDLLALCAKQAEALQAVVNGQGVAIAWAKDKEGKALALTWPGKRSRYLEVAEFRDLRGEVGEQIEAFMGGK